MESTAPNSTLSNNILEIQDIEKIFNEGKRNEVNVLKGIDFQMQAGQFFALMGPSGSGKSTLLNIVGGLLKSSAGTVKIKNIDIYSLKDDQLTALRGANIGWIFQSFGLIDNLTALENIIVPLNLAGIKDKDAYTRAMELLSLVGLEDRADHFPDGLSGGQKQRVAIARALANDPLILYADEPTGNLDTKTGVEIIEIFKKLTKMGKSILMVTHDVKLAHAADQVFILRNGKVEAEMEI
ncbi:putative ABC transporter ATP-binding protein [Candidatus Lokiarchaeum ossiferum]|uniref:ABC transporter ATP-binding protein n=1 Tax=Candidatus Lokiarchaeum ossiferum TaxID=2951803 RepID=A0ABY6HUR1_9ARCH|nr:putative ABC transporter ATP-binding protein [Candidatus Lokiarchaeum sp. B-35]